MTDPFGIGKIIEKGEEVAEVTVKEVGLTTRTGLLESGRVARTIVQQTGMTGRVLIKQTSLTAQELIKETARTVRKGEHELGFTTRFVAGKTAEVIEVGEIQLAKTAQQGIFAIQSVYLALIVAGAYIVYNIVEEYSKVVRHTEDALVTGTKIIIDPASEVAKELVDAVKKHPEIMTDVKDILIAVMDDITTMVPTGTVSKTASAIIGTGKSPGAIGKIIKGVSAVGKVVGEVGKVGVSTAKVIKGVKKTQQEKHEELLKKRKAGN